ncbi:MAG: hypothetical protein ACYCS1_05445 [Gammaproteobacteria bacterium]
MAKRKIGKRKIRTRRNIKTEIKAWQNLFESYRKYESHKSYDNNDRDKEVLNSNAIDIWRIRILVGTGRYRDSLGIGTLESVISQYRNKRRRDYPFDYPYYEDIILIEKLDIQADWKWLDGKNLRKLYSR